MCNTAIMGPKPRRLNKAAKAKAEKEAAEEAVFAAAEEAAAATLLAAAATQTAAAAPAAPDGVPPAPEGNLPEFPRLPPGREDEPEGQPEGELASDHEPVTSDSDDDNVVPIKTKLVEAKGKKKKKDAVQLTDDQEITLFNWLKEHPELYSKEKNYRYTKADVKNELWDSIAANYGKTGKFYVILH